MNQHACQLDASKPARTRDGASDEWKGNKKQTKKTKSMHSAGNKVGIFVAAAAASKQNYDATRVMRAD